MLLTAIEDRRFYPVGSDKQVTSEFQLVAGTNRDLREAVRAGRFRDDLLARLATWTFQLPALRERPEDIAPNLDWELEHVSAELGLRISFAKPARDAFLRFAEAAPWRANFRDFHATAIRRMATLASGGRIGEAGVRAGDRAARHGDRHRARPAVGAARRQGPRPLRPSAARGMSSSRCAAAPVAVLPAAGRELFACSLAARTKDTERRRPVAQIPREVRARVRRPARVARGLRGVASALRGVASALRGVASALRPVASPLRPVASPLRLVAS